MPARPPRSRAKAHAAKGPRCRRRFLLTLSVRVMCDHLLRLPARPIEKLDIFLVSNGGSGTVPWRLVSLFREFSRSFSVLIPYRAYSAASLLALGADEIVMHPFGELGPIDPILLRYPGKVQE